MPTLDEHIAQSIRQSELSGELQSAKPPRWRIEECYVHAALKPLLPALLLGKKVAKLLRMVLRLVATHTYVHREKLSKPRKPGPKPHKYMTQKHC